ncbi:type III secretion system needle filament subunit SctF [Pandoraea commovens]|uniref:EscF/YscF/HrpA family type III secretion system needle major subunit n=1 Tax=Pandoraea commovens TaxID=2508289 RepID=A0A5E4U037_9BURK|nr:type III secretion system needle filament subunit SctF [Pandoraea commovens]UVA79712.1 type III secretion system needle filament subunit SctF [Pandoraea commovens]VVD92852.1 EscF/YscF/HrpA family type III secretion system needle major subunit [Pandoraea commovens]
MTGSIPGIRSEDLTYLEQTSKEFNGPTSALKKRMDEAIDKIKSKPTESEGMAEFQAAMAAYTTMRAAQSGTVKTLKDTVQGVISKY